MGRRTQQTSTGLVNIKNRLAVRGDGTIRAVYQRLTLRNGEPLYSLLWSVQHWQPNEYYVYGDCVFTYDSINAPLNLTWTQKNGNSNTLQWNAVRNASYYELQYAGSSGTFTNWSNNPQTTTTATGNFGSAITYKQRIRVIINDVISEWSEPITINNTAVNFTNNFVDTRQQPSAKTTSWLYIGTSGSPVKPGQDERVWRRL